MTSLWKRQWALLATALTLTVALVSFMGSTGTTAQGIDNLSGAPVDIHEGSCDDFLTEPAYDAGDLEVQPLSEVREGDDFTDSGLLEDGNILGVDVNGDDTLDDTETIGAADDADTQVAVAEADISDGVAEDGTWVAVVHASPDAYDTTLACGSITDAAEDDDGNLVAYMHPTGDASAFGYAVLSDDRNHIDTYLFQPGAAPDAPAATGAEGFPVGIHSGTCTNWTVEPAYDAGLLEVTNVGAEGEQEVGTTDVEVPEEASVLGDVYHVDNEAEFSGNELLDEGPYVVAVHQSEDDYGTLVACGPVLDIPEDDNLMVPLVPVGDSNFTGMALIPQDDEEFTALLWQCEPIEQQEIPTPTPTPEPTNTPVPTNTPTPVPTNTPVPTAVIEETEVITETEVIEVTEVVTETAIVEETEIITETEVVLAPTATALAEQGVNVDLFELGDEPVELTGTAGESFIVVNTADTERTFRVADLGIDETIEAGSELQVILPEEVEAGSYTYEVMEGDESVFEGNLTVE